MSPRDELQELLLATFMEEARDQVEKLNAGVLAYEGEDDPEASAAILNELFREAHNLKGAARSVQAKGIEQIAHSLESTFGELREGKDPEADTFDSILLRVDEVESALNAGPVVGDPKAEPAAAEPPAAESPEPPPTSPPVQQKDAGEPAVGDRSGARVPERTRPPDTSPADSEQPAAVSDDGPAGARPTLSGDDPPSAGGEESIRVATEKLDVLMSQVSELMSARAFTEQRLGDVRRALQISRAVQDGKAPGADLHGQLEELAGGLESDARRIGHITAELSDSVRKTRMQPVSRVLHTLPRMARDLSRSLNKRVDLQIVGGETEVDRSVLEHLKAPLTHLVRNAIDHGIEDPDTRRRQGKPPQGRIEVRATQRGAGLLLTVSDDGEGIDPRRVKDIAAERGLISASEHKHFSDQDALWLIFRPGFSTRGDVSDVSGRGVGMDVVREHVERLHGIIDLQSPVGRGSTFQLRLPLSVASTQCLLVRVAGTLFGIPLTNVDRLVQLAAADIFRTQGHQAIRLDNRAIALADMRRLIGAAGAATTVGARRTALIIGAGEARTGVFVDELVTTEELVVKPFPAPFKRVRYFSGAALTAAGDIVVIINASELLGFAARSEGTSVPVAGEPRDETADAGGQRRLLVVDDSLTIRTLEKNLLQAAGFLVDAAADGRDAWDRLHEGEFDLVVSDIQMPNMDGIELLQRVRADETLQEIPFVLLSAHGSEEDQQAGLSAGADAYIVKGEDQEDRLLQTVRRFL